ncbi:carboxypeptidase-like regulatory domain-containing protein, partial [Corynebacterium afermentans]|uniref:carboxypeptidase-like regulatory domain-containing protein n=1 Tax=Corynebacterium afermentans TaxID=38286 RepID=UPI00257433FB
MYFFLEFLPFTKTTIGAILKNASSPFEFNSDAAAQGPSNPGRYNAMSSADRNPRRHSGKRSVIAGMTSVSLALAGLTVPSIVGGGDSPSYTAAAAETPVEKEAQGGNSRGDWYGNIFDMAPGKYRKIKFVVNHEKLPSAHKDRTFNDTETVELRMGNDSEAVKVTGVANNSEPMAGEDSNGNPITYYVRTLTIDLGDDPAKWFSVEKSGQTLQLRIPGAGNRLPAPNSSGTAQFWAYVTEGSEPPAPTTDDVSGRITDADGNGVGGVTVTIGGKSATTNPDGSYTVEDVPAGNQPVVVDGPDGYTVEAPSSVEVKPDGSTDSVDVKLIPNDSPVSGRITDADGNGVGGVTVTIGGKSATTNPDGSYTVEDVPA